MNKRKVFLLTDNIAGIIADFVVSVFLIALTAVFLICPPLLVFVHGYGGAWALLTFVSVIFLGGIGKCWSSIREEIKRIKELFK